MYNKQKHFSTLFVWNTVAVMVSSVNSIFFQNAGCARVFAQHVTNETVERTYVRIRNTSSIKFLLVKCLYVS